MFELRRASVVGALLSCACVLSVCAMSACAPPRPSHLDAEGSAVHVGKVAPGPGARILGPVEGNEGGGCAGFGVIGTYDGAEADLRNRTAAMGGDYVLIQTIQPPHDTGDRCPDNRMIIHGVAYKTGEAASVAVTASGAPAAPGVSCDPPCSPGYTCNTGSCVALCNPPCGPGQVCRADRVCIPGN